jgi:hypothetical protein
MRTAARIAPRIAVATVLVIAIAFVAGRATAPRETPPVVPGPDRLVDGVGVGFAHSEAGAEAAAAHYVLELERAMDALDPGRTSAVAQLVATSSEAATFNAHAEAALAVERSTGTPLRRVVISSDPVLYSPAGAEVTVLECWIYATASREAVWAIERVSLAWQRGDWRVSAIEGAAPSADESLADLRSQLEFPGLGDASVR